MNGAKNVVGRTLIIANQPFTIVGVMPGGFAGTDPTHKTGIYLPLAAEPVVDAPYNMTEGGISANWINVIGRRKAGVTLEQADAGLRDTTIPIAEEAVAGTDAAPQWIEGVRKNQMRMHAEPGSRGFSFLRSVFEKPLVAVLCMCGAVLLLACLNLASLLMARAAARERELATRLAIGASRGRLVQQLLVEALLMTSLGTAAGLLVAPLLSRALATLLLSKFSYTSLDTGLDGRVFVFAALLTMVAGLVVGLVPALRATSRDVGEQLKVGSYARTHKDRKRLLPRVLLGTEVALALTLVISAGLLAASLTRLYRTGLGFKATGLANLQLDMDKQKLAGAALLRWYEDFADSLGHQPRVASVSYERIQPLSGSDVTSTAESIYHPAEQVVYQNEVGPAYFATMQIPLLAGREFTWRDTNASGLKVLLNEKAAKILFPGRSAIGEQVTHIGDVSREVVGVVGDAKYNSISNDAPPQAYLPITQTTGRIASYAAVVRMNGDAQLLADASRRLAATMAPEIPAPILTTMSRQVDIHLATERMMALLSVFFAGCALLVTGIGLYGTLAYATARRTGEIGIRMALGAQRLQVVLMVFRENLWSTVVGLLAGLGVAMVGAKVLTSFLYGTSVHDPWVLVFSLASLTLIASAASLLPAVKAARIEPMVALRAE
jgi:predicted permease